jgi:hypothetical protein
VHRPLRNILSGARIRGCTAKQNDRGMAHGHAAVVVSSTPGATGTRGLQDQETGRPDTARHGGKQRDGISAAFPQPRVIGITWVYPGTTSARFQPLLRTSSATGMLPQDMA